MYADDHAPPHVHIEGPDFEVLVRLSDQTTIAGGARPGQVAEVLRWMEDEREMLTRKWMDLNERD
jgi:hypothetical protein